MNSSFEIDQRKEYVRQIMAGETTATAIAKETGMDASTISGWKKKYGDQTPKEERKAESTLNVKKNPCSTYEKETMPRLIELFDETTAQLRFIVDALDAKVLEFESMEEQRRKEVEKAKTIIDQYSQIDDKYLQLDRIKPAKEEVRIPIKEAVANNSDPLFYDL